MKIVILSLCLSIITSLHLLGEEPMREAELESTDLSEIPRRYRDVLHRLERPDTKGIDALVAALDEAGQWPDIDYADNKPGRWEPLEHVRRLRQMSLALSASSSIGPCPMTTPRKGSASPKASSGKAGCYNLSGAKLEAAAIRALDHWLANRYQASNWWFNQIGVPRFMRDTAILLEGRLDSARRAGALEVVAQSGKVRDTGANLLWLGELALHHGCLTGDREKVADAARRIRGEIVAGNREGIQEDWSFFQHAERLQMFHYGLSYMAVALPLGWQLRNTPWEYSSDEVSILSNLLLEGAQWMVRGEFTVPPTLDRSAARPGRLKVNLLPHVELWSEVDPDRRAELDRFAGRLTGAVEPIGGFRHFRRADFTVYHRPGYSFFLKTISDRTRLTESINNENLLGRNLNTGDHYLLRTGDEYFNLMPVWDWDRIPGIASADGFDRLERKPFTGGLGDESSGFAAMDVERVSSNDGATLKQRRSWFFHGDTVVALWGGWELGGDVAAPYVVLDQSRLRGSVSVLDAAGRLRQLEAGEHEVESPLAILHDDVAWLPLEAPAVSVRLGPAHGSWHRINNNHSDATVSAQVFQATIHYSGKPEAGGFAVAPGVTADDALRIARRPPWTIVRNDRSIQAVEFNGDVGMAAFFEAGTVDFGERALSVSRPCLVFRRGTTLLAADPTMKGGAVEIQWNGEKCTVDLPPGGGAIPWK